MNDLLHAVFRSTGDFWEAYSRPVSIHAGGRTLDAARDEFARAAEFHFGDDWAQVEVLNHTERQVAPGVYVRTAVDRHTLDRESTARLFRNSLNVPSQLEHLRSGAAEASTGDVVFVCCLASDRLDWVIGQLAGTDSLQVCVSVAGDMLWWTTLAAPNSTYSEEESETLGEAGLTGDAATIADLIRSESQRHPSEQREAIDFDPERVKRRGARDRPTMRGGGRTLLVSR